MKSTYTLCIVLLWGMASCSVESNEACSRIFGGSAVTDIKECPYLVSLRLNNSHICGATILDSLNVITTASCVQKHNESHLSIKVGVANLTHEGQVFKVKKIIIHSAYNSSTGDNDIAILHLNNLFRLDLFNGSKLVAAKPDTNGTVCGWGYETTNGAMQNNLKKITVQILSSNGSLCNETYGKNITDNMICVDEGNTSDSCTGDMGGPLISNGSVVGLVSSSDGNTCEGSNKPRIYTNVIKYEAWIEEHKLKSLATVIFVNVVLAMLCAFIHLYK